MDILIISQYLRDIKNFKDNNSRFVYLAKLLARNPKNKIEIVTSDFNHAEKKHFEKIGDLENVKITALHESGYKKNISLKRFASHKQLAKNIGAYLKTRNKPDVCYCAVPSLDVAAEVAKYCRANKVRFIVDIQDLWPEAFKMVLNVRIVSDLMFAPMKKKADRIYSSAEQIVAVSQTYAERATQVNKICKYPIVVYLGTEMGIVDENTVNKSQSDEVVVGYVGSMSASYDIFTVIDAIADLKIEAPIKFLAMGDGTRRKSFEEYAKEKGINAEFTGNLPYAQMCKCLSQCDIAVNPICKGSAGSIINKVGDYAIAGLPVVNTQECKEYRDLLEKYHAGINCRCENSADVSAALEKLILNKVLRKQMSEGSRRLGEECFDRKNTYGKIIDTIER